MLSSAKPTLHSRGRSLADGGDRFLTHLPFSIELLWSHAKLATAVDDQSVVVPVHSANVDLSFVLLSSNSKSPSQAVSVMAKLQGGCSQIRYFHRQSLQW